MKKIGLILVAAAALGACGHHHHGGSGRMGDMLHTNPLLTVRGPGLISVAPEPIVISLKEQKDQPIVWRAPAGFTFPVKGGGDSKDPKTQKDGIEILGLVVDSQGRPVAPGPEVLKESGLAVQSEGRRAFSCKPANQERTTFSCTVTSSVVKNGVYRYAIRLVDKDGKLIEWDPSVFTVD